MDGIPLGSIPSLSLHDEVDRKEVEADAGNIVDAWISSMNKEFREKSFKNLSNLFLDDCWWRDITGLTWDFASKQGLDAVRNFLTNSTNHLEDMTPIKTGGLQPALVDIGTMIWIQGAFTFRTAQGKGRGLVRLANVSKSSWKAWIVFTQLEQLNF